MTVWRRNDNVDNDGADDDNDATTIDNYKDNEMIMIVR